MVAAFQLVQCFRDAYVHTSTNGTNISNMLKWFESYLSHRTQYVVFDGENSDADSIKCGVPQGSILGPLIFILSVNDICKVSPLLFKILFADDRCALLSGKKLNTLIALMKYRAHFLK